MCFLPFPLILQESGMALYEEVTKGAVSRETLLCSECHSHKGGDVGATLCQQLLQMWFCPFLLLL